MLLWRVDAWRNCIPELVTFSIVNHFFKMTVFKFISLFGCEIVGDSDFLNLSSMHHGLGQFSLKYWIYVPQFEFARQPLPDFFHVSVHSIISAFADIAQDAIDVYLIHIAAFGVRSVLLKRASSLPLSSSRSCGRTGEHGSDNKAV